MSCCLKTCASSACGSATLSRVQDIRLSDVALHAKMLAATQGMTQPPPRLSERNLIAAMERHGIGTDATVADHIKKQLDRGYATKDAQVLPIM